MRLLLTGGGWEAIPDRSNRWVKVVRVDRAGFGSTVDTGEGLYFEAKIPGKVSKTIVKYGFKWQIKRRGHVFAGHVFAST